MRMMKIQPVYSHKSRGPETLYPYSLTRGLRSERALLLAAAELYVRGVSTQWTKKIVRQKCGLDISPSQVFGAAEELDQQMQGWMERELGAYPYIVLESHCEKVRERSGIVQAVVMVACGIDAAGDRDVLACSVAPSEAGSQWRRFLSILRSRGQRTPDLIVCPGVAGIRLAREAVFPNAPWQHCQLSLLSEAEKFASDQVPASALSGEIRQVFDAGSVEEAGQRLSGVARRLRKAAPNFVHWAETRIPESFAVFAFPPSHQRRLRTCSLARRLIEEIKRRSRVVRMYANQTSCLRLVNAVAIEIAEDWQTSERRYLNFDGL
jgi:transposase-like protein